MLYHIHLHSEPHGSIDPSGTHRLTDYPTSEAKLTWKIVDSPVATAFIQATQMILDNQGHSDISPRNFIDWNMYGKHISWGSWKADAALLNAEMDQCTAKDYVQFDETFYIDENISESERASRLNRIHYAFEQELERKETQRTATPQFLSSLERLNKLVHSLEKAPNSKFGESLDISPNGVFAAVGATRSSGGVLGGKVNVYERNASAEFGHRWRRLHGMNVSSDQDTGGSPIHVQEAGHNFGAAVALDNSRLVVGAPFANINDMADIGMAYKYAMVPDPPTDLRAVAGTKKVMSSQWVVPLQNAARIEE